VGRMNSSFIQFRMPADQSAEMGLTPLQIAESRAANHLISIPSIDGVNLAEVKDLPFIVAEGTDELRANQKIAGAFDDALKGATAGALLVAVPSFPAGGVIGALLGGAVAGFVSYADAESANRKEDMTPDMAPMNVIPSPLPAIPEPETYALMLAGLAVVCAMARRRSTLG